MVMTHMTFFWSKNAYILFSDWPGTRTGMYWLSYFHLIKPGPKHVWVGLVQTILHALKVGLAFMVMLAVMSFNVGLFLVAVAGHSVGFLLFRSRVFKDLDTGNCPDVPSSSC
ncbi:copper transporter 1-like [Fagus crenata]